MSAGSTVRRVPLLAALCLTAGCRDKTATPQTTSRAATAPSANGMLFTTMPSAYTGIRFENHITESDAMNVFNYRNFYNGGGVAIGDLNGDGFGDIIVGAPFSSPGTMLTIGLTAIYHGSARGISTTRSQEFSGSGELTSIA